MDKNKKKKAGLHKDISSIFDGVPVPKTDGAQGTAGSPGPEGGSKVPASGPRNPQIPPGPYRPFKQSSGKTEAKQDKAGAAARGGKQGGWQQMSKKLFAPKPGVSAKRQKVTAVLVPILFIILIIVLAKSIGIPSRKPAKPMEPTQAAVVPVGVSVSVPPDSVSGSDTEIAWKMPEPYPTTLRDPMELPAEMAAQIVKIRTKPVSHTGTQTIEPTIDKSQKLLVKGILYSDDNPAAVIGTEIVHMGDKILDATVMKINKDNVEFEKDGKTWTQKVQP